ncbi:MAG: two-component sensor histidine kinase [Planctomycetes bacterium]|nr:two-component sensor histidine kinase [Planctomycetota bacterium]
MAAASDQQKATDDYAALAELAGGFIHEIKNHLNTLNLNLQLLGEDFEKPETQRERRALTRVQKLQVECQRLVDLSNDFLRFAHIKDIPLEPGDLGVLVEEMIDFFTPTARSANIDIKTYLPADLPTLPLNQEMMRQAMLNLMLNAVQAMPEGGELTVQAASIPPSPRAGEGSGVRGSVPPSPLAGEGSGVRGGHVALSLIDTGAGIPPEVLPKIFRPFFSTKSKTGGSGLGLPTTKKIIEAHHGTIEVQSEVGKGTKFTIRLPVAKA